VVNRLSGVVALGEAEAGETGDPRVSQIARASASKAPITRKVTDSSTSVVGREGEGGAYQLRQAPGLPATPAEES
jgi:hypothetical protein